MREFYFSNERHFINYIKKRKAIWANDDYELVEKVLMNDRIKEEILCFISNMSINETTTYELIKTIDMDKYSEIKTTMMMILFCSYNKSLELFKSWMAKKPSEALYIS